MLLLDIQEDLRVKLLALASLELHEIRSRVFSIFDVSINAERNEIQYRLNGLVTGHELREVIVDKQCSA